MKKRIPDKFWFPWWPDKWIFGSVRIEFTPAERGIWVDMLSLASKDDGHIRANEDTPYPLAQLAGMLIIPEEELDAAIKKFIKFKKLTKLKSGTLYVTKWEKYQFSERHHQRLAEDPSEKNLTEKIIKELDAQSPPISHESQKLIKNGRIDIFIPEPYFAIIELKNNSGATNIQMAIGQLLIYKNEYPKAALFIATPERMHKKTLDKIANFKIKQWDLNAMLLDYDIRNPDAMSKKKDIYNIIDNSTLNNNKLNESKIEFSFNERKFFNITIEDKAGWKDAYPACDIEHELRGMKEWLLSNPSKKKSNYRKFITNWLSRQQDKGGTKSSYEDKRKKELDDWTKEP